MKKYFLAFLMGFCVLSRPSFALSPLVQKTLREVAISIENKTLDGDSLEASVFTRLLAEAIVTQSHVQVVEDGPLVLSQVHLSQNFRELNQILSEVIPSRLSVQMIRWVRFLLIAISAGDHMFAGVPKENLPIIRAKFQHLYCTLGLYTIHEGEALRTVKREAYHAAEDLLNQCEWCSHSRGQD